MEVKEVSTRKLNLVLLLGLLFGSFLSYGQKQVLDPDMHFLRVNDEAEWADFPETIPDHHLQITFEAQTNETEQTISFRQRDVKQTWHLLLNDQPLGTLTQDENDMRVYLSVPSGTLTSGANTLRIEPEDTTTDDIAVGQFTLHARPRARVLSEASVQVRVVDGDTQQPLPSRITIADGEGALQTVEVGPAKLLAVRPGFVYTGNGTAAFGLPAGRYTLYAGRGFEYDIDTLQIDVSPGDQLEQVFTIHREVATEGWVSSDTHIHTLTHSGHGDASIEERVLTIAGEGIELPILTEHNKHVDIQPVATALGMNSHFTSVMGNEYTTPLGHFNLFPVTAENPPPAAQVTHWNEVAANIEKLPAVQAVVLNHARDVHNGFRPFGEQQHLASAGINRQGWTLPANAMEIINSGAQQTDFYRLLFDWLGLLNRGLEITPIGASDSHDVGRYLVGQARTYIRAQDDSPGRIEVDEALNNLVEGRVVVSFGLFTEITVDRRYGPGEVVSPDENVSVTVRVSGPGWMRANRISLYANGTKVREGAIDSPDAAGVKGSMQWVLPLPEHDVFLVALAEGPYDYLPFWPVAKPYQPRSPLWQPAVFSATGPIWVDVDGDGKPTSARAYAEALVAAHTQEPDRLITALHAYDEAVAIQVAAVLTEKGTDLADPAFTQILEAQASEATRAAFEKFREEWQASERIDRY